MVDRIRANSAGPRGPERLVVFALVVSLTSWVASWFIGAGGKFETAGR